MSDRRSQRSPEALVAYQERWGRPRQGTARRRCAMPRVWELLERGAAADPRVRLWRQVDWYGRHVRVAARDWSMVAILLERPNSLVLKTAYPLEAPTRGALRSQARASWMRVWAERVSSE